MSTAETKQHPFISYLQKNAENRAMLAALRRGLGADPGEAPGMFPYVVPRIRKEANKREESDMFMIAALFALHPSSTRFGNMGEHMRKLDPKREDDATERRFVQLLRMRRDTLEPRLRQQISILASKDIAVNWHQLIGDLGYWDHPNRYVQRRWAQGFWGSYQSESDKERTNLT